MSEIDLAAEREASLARNEEAHDRQTAGRMATELWLGSDRLRVTERAISDALALRASLSSYSSERIERLVGYIRDALKDRQADYEKRRAGPAPKRGRKPGKPIAADFCDGIINGADLGGIEVPELAALVEELYAKGWEEGIFGSTMSQTWYGHIRPALHRAGWTGTLTLEQLMKSITPPDTEPMSPAEFEARASPPPSAEELIQEHGVFVLKSSPESDASVGGKHPGPEDDGTEKDASPSAPHPALAAAEPRGPWGDGTLALPRHIARLMEDEENPTDGAATEELTLEGPWGDFRLTRLDGATEVHVRLRGRVSPKAADRIAAIMLAEKYCIDVDAWREE